MECKLFTLNTCIMSVPAVSPLSAQQFSKCGQQPLGRCSWHTRLKRFVSTSRSIRQARAQTSNYNIGADADQCRPGSDAVYDGDDDDDDALHQKLAEEFPIELADDVDPEGRELTLEDLITARSGTAQSLRDELRAGDVWGPSVRPQCL